MAKKFGIGYQREDGKVLVAYHVYEAPEGCSSFLGRASSLREARSMAAKGGGLEESLWETARAAGHVAGMYAPDLDTDEEEDEEPAAWFGRGGYYCAVPIWR